MQGEEMSQSIFSIMEADHQSICDKYNEFCRLFKEWAPQVKWMLCQRSPIFNPGKDEDREDIFVVIETFAFKKEKCGIHIETTGWGNNTRLVFDKEWNSVVYDLDMEMADFIHNNLGEKRWYSFTEEELEEYKGD